MIRINLLPEKAARKKEQMVAQLAVLVLAVVLVLVACGGLQFMLSSKIEAQRQMINSAEQEVSSLRKKIGEVSRIKKLQKELQGKLEVLDKLKEAKTGPVHLLDELSLAVPDKLWLVSFRETAGEKIELSGVGLNEATVALFLRNLEASPYYKDIELQVVEQVSQGGQKLQRFSVTGRKETPPKPEEANSSKG